MSIQKFNIGKAVQYRPANADPRFEWTKGIVLAQTNDHIIVEVMRGDTPVEIVLESDSYVVESYISPEEKLCLEIYDEIMETNNIINQLGMETINDISERLARKLVKLGYK